MPERFVFIHPATLIAIFREAADDDTRLIFRRFTPSGHEAGQYVIELDDHAAQQYMDGGYSIMYLSPGPVPAHSQDWQFRESARSQLIEITGCRVRDDVLEEAQMRTTARISRAVPLFQRIDRRIKKVCRQGMRIFDRDRVDLTKWYDPHVLSMTLQTALESPEYTWLPVSEEAIEAARKRKKPELSRKTEA